MRNWKGIEAVKLSLLFAAYRDKSVTAEGVKVWRALMDVSISRDIQRRLKRKPDTRVPVASEIAKRIGKSLRYAREGLRQLRDAGIISDGETLVFKKASTYEARKTLNLYGVEGTQFICIPTEVFKRPEFDNPTRLLTYLAVAIRCIKNFGGVWKLTGKIARWAITEATGIKDRTLCTIFSEFEKAKFLRYIHPSESEEPKAFKRERRGGRRYEMLDIPKQLVRSGRKFAGNLMRKCSRFAGVYRKENLPTEDFKNQKENSGVSLRDVKLENLSNPKQLYGLFRQAKESGLVGETESDKLKFVSLAFHALRRGTNPVKLFCANLKAGRFETISGVDEDKARKLIARGREQVRGLRSQIEVERLPETITPARGVPELRGLVMASLAEADALMEGKLLCNT